MKVLVTGNSGQVAQSLFQLQAQHPQFSFHFTTRSEIDLQNPNSIEKFIDQFSPNFIISAAAWTEVDRAEDEAEAACMANAVAPGVIAEAAQKCGAKLIHLSTDYVYDGEKIEPYIETDQTNPQNIYGSGKLAGEKNIAAQMSDYAIIRTAWVFSPYGNNFAKTMLKLAKDKNELTVVNDQFGNPTSAIDLAVAILSILDNWRKNEKTSDIKGLGQLYLCSGSGETNWADFARQIFEVSEKLGGASAKVTGIPSSQWPTKAVRPKNSSLNCAKLKRDFGIVMPDWKSSVEKVVERLILDI